MAEFTLIALRDEIVNDTEALGYKNSATPNDWKEDQIIADLINAKNLVIDRSTVSMESIRGATEFDWYDGAAIDKQEWLRWQTPNSGNWVVSANMKLQLTGKALTINGVAGVGVVSQSFWSAQDDQDAAPVMLALIEIPGSRAEVVWGESRVISLANLGGAFNLLP